MLLFTFWTLSFLFGVSVSAGVQNSFKEVVTNFTLKLSKGRDVIIFGCDKEDLLETTKILLRNDLFVYPIKLSGFSSHLSLSEILTRHSHARTSVIVDCQCNGSLELLEMSSVMLFFNKTYQWLLWDEKNIGVEILFPPKLKYPGLNSQVTYVNGTANQYTFWDIHSKGRHLNSSLEFHIIATYNRFDGFKIIEDINAVQGINFRGQFNGLKLRGASVIDQDNIITNVQIETILSRPSKDPGVATFVKYHYELLNLLRHRLNFTVNYRNARGWAGRLGNTSFRLGYLGIVQRNEVDIGASGAFNRLNRFAEFDIIHQSWKFETGFLFRFTPELDTDGKSGNFLAPFDDSVWIYATVSICAVNCVWRLIERINDICHLRKSTLEERSTEANKLGWVNDGKTYETNVQLDRSETSWSSLSLKTFAAVCQQGMDSIPEGLSSRTIVLTMFLFSLVMYNYYTSSVVGGLLSNTAHGPSTLDQIISSPLKLSFEDIGYNRILFREGLNKSVMIKRMYNLKVSPERSPNDMPVYTQLEKAIPYLKKGGYAFHCEVLDAYPEVARHFDAGEICDLRLVSGLLETEIFNWGVPKQSQYSEIFRIVMHRNTEVGLVKRILRQRRPDKPPCQALYRVFPIDISGVSSAFILLAAGFASGFMIMCIERKVYKMKNDRSDNI